MKDFDIILLLICNFLLKASALWNLWTRRHANIAVYLKLCYFRIAQAGINYYFSPKRVKTLSAVVQHKKKPEKHRQFTVFMTLEICIREAQ